MRGRSFFRETSDRKKGWGCNSARAFIIHTTNLWRDLYFSPRDLCKTGSATTRSTCSPRAIQLCYRGVGSPFRVEVRSPRFQSSLFFTVVSSLRGSRSTVRGFFGYFASFLRPKGGGGGGGGSDQVFLT